MTPKSYLGCQIMCQDKLAMSKELQFNKLLLIYLLWYLGSNAQPIKQSTCHAERAQVIVSQMAVKFAYYF